MTRFRRRLRRDVRALGEGREPRQPTADGPGPIPTWSGDTILRIPAVPGEDDRAQMKERLARVVSVLSEGDRLCGPERDAFITSRLRLLETQPG